MFSLKCYSLLVFWDSCYMYESTSLFLTQTVSVGRRRFSAEFQLAFRLIKGMIFLTFISILVTLIALPHMTVQDIFVCILAFMPTGWGMLLVSEYLSVLYIFFANVPDIWLVWVRLSSFESQMWCRWAERSIWLHLGYLNYALQVQYLAEFRPSNFKFASL